MARVLAACAGAALMLATLVQAQEPAEAAQRKAREAQAVQQLETLRAQIKVLAEQQQAAGDERDAASRALREQDLALAAVAAQVRALDTQLTDQQREIDRLERERVELEARLLARKQDLARLLRSAYALGNHEELKLLLQQDDVAAIARVLAYHRYFQRAQLHQIDALRAQMQQLAQLQDAIRAAHAGLFATRDARSAEQARLETERGARARLVAELEARLKAQGAQLASLGRDEGELKSLLERLRDVFADIPARIQGAESLAALRGRLRWPVSGRIASAFGTRDAAGRRSSGVLIAAKAGTPVHAVARGRVAFADWLRGYGLVIVVEHGDGYLSLYGCNETLLKEVGDWVDPGDAIATSGASGGQSTPGLYFELRANGQAVDPRGWLR